MAQGPDPDDLGAIDKLLAETDHGWDVEAQVLTLKQAAATKPLAEQSGAGESAATPLRQGPTVPTPLELAPADSVPPPRAAALEGLPTLRVKPKRPSKAPPSKAPPSKVPPLRRKGPPPLPSGAPRASERPGSTGEPTRVRPDTLVDLLLARIATLEARDDGVGLARAHVELAVACEIGGDDAGAMAHAETALKVNPTATGAHALLRRKKHGRSALPEMLAHLEQEILAATEDEHRAALFAEKARLLEAAGDRGNDVRAAWQQALAHSPNQPAALKGLETELLARALARGAPADWEDWELLATHLATMSDAYASDARLAAWLHVERARILERKLGRLDAARSALDQALFLDASIGPVRGALIRHVAAHADWSGLASLLEEEARIEDNVARAARLELDAAGIASARLADRTRAGVLLERAAARAPTDAGVDRRVLDELMSLREPAGQWAEAARARRARIRFVTEPAALAHELRLVAAAAERSDDVETAISDLERALTMDPTDPTLAEALDNLLRTTQRHDQRIALWLHEAARLEQAQPRARALLRAAAICDELGRRADAVRHLRSAWVAAPGDGEVLDALARQLAPAIPETTESGPRALVDLYAQAAECAADGARKVAFLERVALMWEELLGDPVRAAKTYQQALELEPGRRSALLGLQRTAAKTGDAHAQARALADEARLATDETERRTLRLRAAGALVNDDAPRAMQLVREVLEYDPTHRAARALETQLEQRAERWEMAAKSIRARIDAATTAQEQVALWLGLARIQRVQLHAPAEAIASLERAWAIDPAHPVLPEEIVSITQELGDARALRDALERMSAHAASPHDRVRHLVHVAEIEELSLRDDAAAIRTLQRVLSDAPGDELAGERLARVVARHALSAGDGDLGELIALLAKRIERAPTPEAGRRVSFDVAMLLVDSGRDSARAATLLESALVQQADQVPALRTLESLRRRGREPMALARVLDKEGHQFGDTRARLGALWNLAALEEWKLSVGNPTATYRRILELEPADACALEGLLRHELGEARTGETRAARSAASALRALLGIVTDHEARLAFHLLLAMLLEKTGALATEPRASEDLARDALGNYRDALRLDGLSVAAATGVARLAARFRDTEAALAASRSLAEIAVEPRVRSRYLVEASEFLLGGDDDKRLGTSVERRTLATSLLERALEADPDSIAAAGRLSTVLLQDKGGERLVSAFLAALGRTASAESAVMLGSEVARVARDELHDLTVAIDAMRRVRSAAPQHIPSLLTLAELCIAQRAWPEAVDALEAVVSNAHEPGHKLTALFALASIYEKVLLRPQDVDRVLRAAVTLDPNNTRAIGALLRRAAAEPLEGDDAAVLSRRKEIAELLERLAGLERTPQQKTLLLMELADARSRLGETKAAERAMVEAVATSPSNAHAFARLATFFHRTDKQDDVGYARALNSVIALGQQLGTMDARWFAALGRLEIQSQGRSREGIAHLQRAIALDASLYDTRFELAQALERMGAHDDAARAVVAMLSPQARPLLSLADPPAALRLLEKAFVAERRPDEATVAAELRALGGDLESPRVERLRARRLPRLDPQQAVLDRHTLVTQVVPVEARHILLEVAAAIAGVEGKVLRADLSEVGLGSRDRINPRDRHPLRALLDRLARQLGSGEVELAITPGVLRTRVFCQDVPWIVVPDALTHAAEPMIAATFARALARIALGAPWLDELAPSHVEALLVAAARQVVPNFGSDDAAIGASPLVAHYSAALSRALSRRQRKLLEEIAGHIASPQGRPPGADAFVGALRRAELRGAFLVTGDFLALIDELRSTDARLHRAMDPPGPQALIAALDHPLAGDLARFALTAEATALRRRLGATWASA